VTKESLAESNTSYAQGGIAVAMGGEEDVALHLSDTIAAGDGAGERQGLLPCWWRRGRGALASCCGGGLDSTGIRRGIVAEGGTARAGELMRDDGGRAQPAANSTCQWGCDGTGDCGVAAAASARVEECGADGVGDYGGPGSSALTTMGPGAWWGRRCWMLREG